MALHRALPMGGAVQIGIMRLGSDGGREHQHLGAHQSQRPCGFRKPLIPTHPASQPGVTRLNHLEPGIAGREIELLLIARGLRDMRLAVVGQYLAISVYHRQRVVMRETRTLEIGDRQDHLQPPGQIAKMLHQTAVLQCAGQGQVPRRDFETEIGCLEQFLQQDDLRAILGGGGDDILGFLDVLILVPGTGHLGGRDGDIRHDNLRSAPVGGRSFNLKIGCAAHMAPRDQVSSSASSRPGHRARSIPGCRSG